MAAVSGALRFWGSAALAAAVLAALALLVPLHPALSAATPEHRERAWLLTVFCSGVMLLLFGATARLGGLRGISAQDVVEAGSVREAMERRKKGARGLLALADRWVMAAGAWMIAIYLAAYLALN